MNTDKLYQCGDPGRMRQAAFRVISRTQDDPVSQVQAMAIALFSTCSALDIDIKQLLISTERMRDDLNGPFQGTFAAIEEYARQEIGRR